MLSDSGGTGSTASGLHLLEALARGGVLPFSCLAQLVREVGEATSGADGSGADALERGLVALRERLPEA